VCALNMNDVACLACLYFPDVCCRYLRDGLCSHRGYCSSKGVWRP
jgi:hypothetical protein